MRWLCWPWHRRPSKASGCHQPGSRRRFAVRVVSATSRRVQTGSAIAFLRRVVDWFAKRSVTVREVMTDNGSYYISHDFAAACRQLRLRHLSTRPNRPRTNGKAERFIQTVLREWAYAAAYQTSNHRALALGPWLDYYNHRRPHGALGHRPPASQLPAA
jgi:transposase InsO family protein